MSCVAHINISYNCLSRWCSQSPVHFTKKCNAAGACPAKDDDASHNLKEHGFYLATERIGAVASRLVPRAAAACSHVRTHTRRSSLLFVPPSPPVDRLSVCRRVSHPAQNPVRGTVATLRASSDSSHPPCEFYPEGLAAPNLHAFARTDDESVRVADLSH